MLRAVTGVLPHQDKCHRAIAITTWRRDHHDQEHFREIPGRPAHPDYLPRVQGRRPRRRWRCAHAGRRVVSLRRLPRVDVAVLVWAGDDEEPGEARVLFDANAGHYLPAEDLAGLGGQLAHRLAGAARV